MSYPINSNTGTRIVPPPMPKKPESAPTPIPRAINSIIINVSIINTCYFHLKALCKGDLPDTSVAEQTEYFIP
jgi:hypothetical protein